MLIAVLAFIHHKSQQAFHDLQALTAVPSAEQVVVVEVVVQQVQPPTLVEVLLHLFNKHDVSLSSHTETKETHLWHDVEIGIVE